MTLGLTNIHLAEGFSSACVTSRPSFGFIVEFSLPRRWQSSDYVAIVPFEYATARHLRGALTDIGLNTSPPLSAL